MFLPIHCSRVIILATSGILAAGAIYAIQPFREYPGVEYSNFPIPPDFQEKTEWVFARLMYPPVNRYYGGFEFLGDWRQGASNWTMDYPRSDRHFSAALRRLTRVHARSAEQPVNLDDRYQVPGAQFLETHQLWEKDGKIPHWRGIYDDKGRLMVAICFDMDLGDSWEHADNPQYPEKFSALGIRIGVDYVIYAMTH